jgi:hypothetical protein
VIDPGNEVVSLPAAFFHLPEKASLRYTHSSVGEGKTGMATLLKDIVPQILSQDGWQMKLTRQWNEAVGPLNTRIRLEKIYEDTLVVGVYEQHWMQELYLLSPLLKDSINKFLGEQCIEHLRFVLVEDKQKTPRKPKPKLLVRPKTIMLSSGQKKVLSEINDEEFRNMLIDYWGRCCAQEDKG